MRARRAPAAVPPEQNRADRLYQQYEAVNVAVLRVALLGSLLAADPRNVAADDVAIAGVWIREIAEQIQTGLSALYDTVMQGESDVRS